MKTAVVWIVCLSGFVYLAAGAAVAGENIDWAKMNAADRKKHMQDTVLPEMKKKFVAADASRFADMTCETCHGAKAEARQYKMPNPELVKLPPPMDKAGFTALHQKNPAMAKFMGNEVKPAMTALLGLEPWTPSNSNGFGCYNCHTREGETATLGKANMGAGAGTGPAKEPAPDKEPSVTKTEGGLKQANLLDADAAGATKPSKAKAAKKEVAKRAAKKKRAKKAKR